MRTPAMLWVSPSGSHTMTINRCYPHVRWCHRDDLAPERRNDRPREYHALPGVARAASRSELRDLPGAVAVVSHGSRRLLVVDLGALRGPFEPALRARTRAR